MRKITKRIGKKAPKILSFLLSLQLLFTYAVYPATVFAAELEETEESLNTDFLVTANPVEEETSELVEEVVKVETEEENKIDLVEVEEEVIELTPDSPELETIVLEEELLLWNLEADGSYSLNGNVELGVIYSYPENQDVKVEFTSLPVNPGSLKINEVSLKPLDIQKLQSVGKVGYEITSDMVDGTFSYNLTLPVSGEVEDVDVVYSENVALLDFAKDVESAVYQKDNTVTVYGLNHFTVFVVVTPDSSSNDASVGSQPWVNLENGYVSDNTYATVLLNSSIGNTSNFAIFNNTNSIIPSDARIIGIEVSIERSVNPNRANNTRDYVISLLKGGVPVGTPITWDSLEYWTTTDTVKSYGSENDLWGTTWTADEINNSLGLALSVMRNSGSADQTAQIDEVEFTVYYMERVDGMTVYKGHNSLAENEIGCGGYTNTTQIRVEWTASIDPDLDFYYFGNKTNPYLRTVNAPGYYYDANMTPGNNPYFYTVIAVDDDGNESLISDQCYVTLDQVLPVITVDPLRTNDTTPELTGTIDEATSLITITVNGSSYTAVNNGDGTWTLANDTVAALLDGLYDVSVEATDLAGNVGVDTTTNELEIDTIAPSVPTGLQSLGADSHYYACGDLSIRQSVNPMWDEVTGDYFDHYEYSSFNPDGSTGLIQQVFYTNVFDTGGWVAPVDGTYGFAVRSVDDLGNKSDWALTAETLAGSCQITFDSTAPVVFLISPADNYFTNQTVVPQVWDSLDTDVFEYEYRSCSNDSTADGFCNLIYSTTTDLKTRTVNNNNIAFWWQVRAVDLVGNVGEWTEAWKMTIDTVAPSAPVIVFPINNGDAFNTTPILNDWTDVIDFSGVSYYRIEYVYDDGHSFSNMPYRTTTVSQRNHTPALSEEGGVSFRVQAFDNAGNEGAWSEWRHYYYDYTAPELSDVVVVTDFNPYVLGDLWGFNIYAPVTDILGSGVNKCEYSLDGGVTYLDATYNGLEGRCEVLNVTASDGTVLDIKVRATDVAGNVSVSDNLVNRTADSQNPVTQTPVISPMVSGFTSYAPTITANVSDSVSEVVSCQVRYAINGVWTPWDDAITDGSECETQLNLEGLVSNNDRLRVVMRSIDSVGHVGLRSLEAFAFIDLQLPVTRFTNAFELNDSYWNSQIPLRILSTDNVGIARVELSWRQSGTTEWNTLDTITAGGERRFETTYFWTPGADGTYDVRAYAVDVLGNVEQTAYVYGVTYDTVAPVVEILTPLENEYVSGTYTFSGTGQDETNLRRVAIRIDGELIYFEARPFLGFGTGLQTLNYDFDTSTLENGSHTVLVRAFDMAGNMSEKSYNFIVDNEKPEISLGDDMLLNEGQMLNMGFLDGKSMTDNEMLDEAYVKVNFTGEIGGVAIDEDLIDTWVDVSDAGCGYTGCGKGGTLNELFYEIFGFNVTFGDYEFPVNTAIFQEGVYTFDYYVTDMAGNRSDCNLVEVDDQNCVFTVTINNVEPSVDLEANQTINEGSSANFTGLFSDPSSISLLTYLEEMFGDTTLVTGSIARIDGVLEESVEEEDFFSYALMYGDDAPWSAKINYGLGEPDVDLGDFETPGEIIIPSKVYPMNGTFTATFTVCEATHEENILSEEKCGSDSVIVTVLNVVPTVSVTANPGTAVFTGTSVTLTGSITGGNSPYVSKTWSGSCSGSGATYTLPSVAGVYTCSYTVVDADGDTDSDSITVTIVNPATSPVLYQLAEEEVLGEDEEVEEEEEEETNGEAEVLGLQTCDEKMKVDGYVYYDKNENGEKDDNERGLKDVELTIVAFDEDDKEFVVDKVTTDKDGYWSSEVCPGTYEVRMNEDGLPKGAKVLGEAEKELKVADEKVNLNFAIEKEVSFLAKWWWFILLLLGLLLLAGWFITRRKEEVK